MTMHNLIKQHLQNSISQIDQLVKDLQPYDQKHNLPMNHFFGKHLYVRQAFYPKGSIVVGRIHKYDHVFMLVSGKITVWTVNGKQLLTGPCIFESKAGTQRVGYVHAHAMCLNMHGVADETEISSGNSDEFLTVANDQEYEEFLGVIGAMDSVAQIGDSSSRGLLRALAPASRVRRGDDCPDDPIGGTDRHA